jgi:hypothetical protein
MTTSGMPQCGRSLVAWGASESYFAHGEGLLHS